MRGDETEHYNGPRGDSSCQVMETALWMESGVGRRRGLASVQLCFGSDDGDVVYVEFFWVDFCVFFPLFF